MKYPLTYLADNRVIQDWVKLPTKDEMDLWRKQNTSTWKCKQKTFITSAAWDRKISITKYINNADVK